MEPATLADLSTVAVRVSADESCDVVERRFRRDPDLRSVIVDLPDGGLALIDRLRFENALAGPFGYGRALHQDKPCLAFADTSPLVLAGDETMTDVASQVLSRPARQRYTDAIVREGDHLRTLSVAVLLEALANVHAHRARHDSLTGLANRSAVLEQLDRHAETGVEFAVAYLDVDGFKRVNDSFGHRVGDALLRIVAQRLQQAVRSDDLVARMGGDEFVAVLVGSPVQARRSATRLLDTLQAPITIGVHALRVAASVGLAFSGSGGCSAETLLQEADEAMYAAKRRPGSQLVEVGDGSPAAGIVASLADLRAAIEHEQLVLHYQPITDLASSDTIAVEALVRWPRADGSLRAPDAFIPLAESTGLIIDLGRWVLREACAQVTRWDTTPGIRAPDLITVNVSAHQLAAPSLVDDVRDALARAGLAPSRLCLEVTESAIVRDIELARGRLVALRRLGVRVAMDDFGVGQSSLAQLTQLPLSHLKIDRSFVGRMLRADADHRVVRLIVSLAQGLGMPVVAEGVEEPEQAGALRSLGCDYGQGFHFSQPLAAADLEAYLRRTDGVPTATGASVATSAP